MNESINTRKYTQKLWNKVKDTFLTKEYVIKGALVGQEWTLFESTVANSPIVLPPSDSFIELYIEMYSSNNGTITHQKTMRMDSILFESDNMEYREVVLDSMYDAQTYVRYDFATNSIIPTVYEGNEITDSSSDIITTIYTKTNKIEAGSIEAEKIVIDNTTNNLNAKNMQGALDEVVDKLNNLSDGNPQDITKEDIGLGNVDNTSDLDKPVSTAQQTAIDNAVTESKGYTDTKVADLVGSAPETLNALEEIVQAIEENEDVVEALNSAIGTKANQSDLDELSNIVDTKASQDDLTELQNTVNENIGIQLSEHTSNTSNPHGVNASQLGLGNVDNTSDLDKPVSTATQTVINNSLSESKDYTDNKVADLVGTVPETLNTLEKVAQAIEDNGDAIETLNGTIESKANQSDLEALSNTVDTKASQDDLAELQSTVNENIGVQLSTHTSNTSNPHGVTASQLGLDNVDNTSDLDKPVSTPQQEAINNSLYESKDYTDTKVAELIGDVIGDDGTELADTLLSGQTTITFTSEEITNDSKLNAVYTSIFDVPLESATFEDGTLTLVFPAQEEDMTVVALINATSFGDDIVAREVMDELNETQDELDMVKSAVNEMNYSVGYTRKNLLNVTATTQTLNGVIFTVNADKSITVKGTAEDKTYLTLGAITLKKGIYKLNGCMTGDNAKYCLYITEPYTVNYTADVEFIVNEDITTHVVIYIANGVTIDETFYPMVRYASIEESTYELYKENSLSAKLDMVKSAVGYSKKQLIPYPYSDTTMTYREIIYTDNGDGTITANGTTTDLPSSFSIRQRLNDAMILEKGTYILSGCPKESNGNCYLILVDLNGNSIARDFGDGVTFALEEDTEVGLAILVVPNYNVNGLTFKPMIRYASIEDSTYEQYIEDIDTRLNNVQEVFSDTVLPRYKVIHPNKIGWYRIAQIKLSNLATLKGSASNSCEIEFKRNFSNNPTEYKKIQMISLYEATKFCDEISKGSNLIASIRHTIDTTNMVGYIEIYYNSTNMNATLVTLSNHMNLIGVEWELISPELTEETVEGVTVLGSHDFSFNFDVQTQINTLKTVENIFQTKYLDFTDQYTDVYTYTATRKCIISLSCTALYNNTVPHAVQITDGVNMLVNNSVNSTDNDIPGSISASQTLMLNVGDTIKAQVKYKTAGKNNITYCGCIQYLE